MEQKEINPELLAYIRYGESPLLFIKDTLKLVPQPCKPEYRPRYQLGLALKGKAWDVFASGVTQAWFEHYEEDKHITWQQTLALFGVEKALRGECSMRISIVSGHGIGKSTLLAWLILWFLYTKPYSQIACTSPSKEQMYDVLWKELKKWIDKFPPGLGQQFVWETTHIRIREKPETWFARAKTSSKENTEALAGVHADWVLMAVDEASGVEEPIFETMEGALTSGNALVFLISNGTRSIGYFRDTHRKDAERWQTYAFNAEQSPRVKQKAIDDWRDKYGEDSIQYKIRVLGQFPDEGVMDDKGYVQLFDEKIIRFRAWDPHWQPVGRVLGALDASGEGQDSSEWGARDRQVAAIIASEQESTPASMGNRSLTLCDKYYIDPSDFVIDAFGKGHQVSQEIALATSQQKRPWRVHPINPGDACDHEDERELYINLRAMGFYKMMLWARAGGEFMVPHTLEKKLLEELLSIRFKRSMNGRIQIMDKVTMKKLGFRSPNMADALSMTFLRPDGLKRSLWGNTPSQASQQFDPHSAVGDV